MQKLVEPAVMGSAGVRHNRLQIVVPRQPEGNHWAGGPASPGLVVVLCAPAVPCGRYAPGLAKGGRRPGARQPGGRCQGSRQQGCPGGADAGIVYVTDVKAGGVKVQGIVIPDNENVVATYPIAVLKAAHDGRAAQAFVDFVLSLRASVFSPVSASAVRDGSRSPAGPAAIGSWRAPAPLFSSCR